MGRITFFSEYDGNESIYTPDSMTKGGIEGYSGIPIHFISIDTDYKMKKLQEDYVRLGRKNFNKNRHLIEACIKTGIMLPPFNIQDKING